MPSWRLIRDRTRIPVPGGKLIEELIGRVATDETRFSLAHMVAPPGWDEPAQTPRFGELTLLVRGRFRVEVGEAGREETIDLAAGEAFWVEPEVRVRYSNPFEDEAEYYALCLPAFSPDTVRREEA